MALSQNAPATDSAAELNEIIGSDSTATFENDPKFIDSETGASGSSENLNAAKADTEEEDDELDDEEDDDDEFDEDDGDDDEEETEEEDAGTDEEDEDDEEDEYDDDDDDEVEDEDEEDDAEEVAASSSASETLRADGLLGYEDEADDVHEGIDERQGNAERAKKEAALKDGEDDDAGDDGRDAAVDEDKLNSDQEVDLDGDSPDLTQDETTAIHKGLRMLTALAANTRSGAHA